MNMVPWTLLGVLVCSACSAESADEPSTKAAPAAQAAPPIERPQGWSEASHAKGAAPDYARVFPDDRVQRLDLVLTPEASQRLFDDLRQRLGDPATGTQPAAVTACAELAEGAPCSFLELQGVCVTQSTLGSVIRGRACRSADMLNPRDLVPGDPIVVPATVRYDGRTWGHVAVRARGNSSLAHTWTTGVRKLGLKLNFDKLDDEHPEVKGQRFFGFSELVLAPGYSDASLLREKLASDLMRDQGIVGAQAGFYRVFVDVGEGPVYWGLYTMLEDPTDRLLDVQFGDDSGNVYKPDGPGADFATFDVRFFDKRNNDPSDFSDVKRLYDALHAPTDDPARFRAGVEAALDVEAFLRNLAFDRAVNHWDSYGTFEHNYYLYGDPSHGGRLVWIGWDHNNSWTTGFFGQPSVMMDEISVAKWPLLRLLADPVYRARYRAHLAALGAGPYAKQAFDAHVRALHDLIAPYVVGPEGERAPYTFVPRPEAFLSGPSAIIGSADGRRAAIQQALAREGD